MTRIPGRQQPARLGSAAAFALTLLSQAICYGSGAPAYQLSVYRVETPEFPEVRCLLSLTDPQGRAVPGLSVREFSVSESGAPAAIRECVQLRPEDQEMDVLLAIDRSGSMRGTALEVSKQAASDFVTRLGPGDRCALMTFSSRVNRPRPLSTDRAALKREISGLRAGGNTALYQAVAAGSDFLAKSSAERKALVVLTDGQDTHSPVTLDDAGARARAKGIEVYAIGLGPKVSRPVLQTLGARTGGAALFSASPEALVDTYRRLLGQMRTRYELTYVSPRADSLPAVREVTVAFHVREAEASAWTTYAVPQFRDESSAGSSADVPLLAGLGILGLVNVVLACVAVRRRRRRVAH